MTSPAQTHLDRARIAASRAKRAGPSRSGGLAPDFVHAWKIND
jgi:hypothetical protein